MRLSDSYGIGKYFTNKDLYSIDKCISSEYTKYVNHNNYGKRLDCPSGSLVHVNTCNNLKTLFNFQALSLNNLKVQEQIKQYNGFEMYSILKKQAYPVMGDKFKNKEGFLWLYINEYCIYDIKIVNNVVSFVYKVTKWKLTFDNSFNNQDGVKMLMDLNDINLILSKTKHSDSFSSDYISITSTNFTKKELFKKVLNTNEGHVYLMDDNKYYKIGKAKSPLDRLSELTTANPDIKLIKTIKTIQMKELERFLHKKFKKHHYKLEWFMKSEEILTYFNENS